MDPDSQLLHYVQIYSVATMPSTGEMPFRILQDNLNDIKQEFGVTIFNVPILIFLFKDLNILYLL